MKDVRCDQADGLNAGVCLGRGLPSGRRVCDEGTQPAGQNIHETGGVYIRCLHRRDDTHHFWSLPKNGKSSEVEKLRTPI